MLFTHFAISLALPLAAPAQEKPRTFFYVRPDTAALTLVAQETHDLLLTSLTTQFGEKEPMAQTVAMRLRTRFSSAIAEEPQGLEGLGDALRRRYIALEGTIQIVDPASVNEEEETWNGLEIGLMSPLEGTSVAFVPVAAQPDGFGRHFDGAALRESVLPKLAAPADWSRILPPVSEANGGEHTAALGDEWDVPPAALESLLAPGGYLGWRKPRRSKVERTAQDADDTQILRAFAGGVGGNLQVAFDGTVNGTAKARLMTVGVDQDQGRYGQVEINYDLTFRADRTDFIESRRIADEGELDIDILGGDLELRLKGVAAVNWGLDAGRPFEAVARAEETLAISVRVLPESGDVVTQRMSMSGELLNTIRFKESPLAPSHRTVVPTAK